MSKTIEIWHHGRGSFEIVSPDQDEIVYADGYILDVDDREALMEDGVQTVDISKDKYFHVEKGGKTATISVSDEPPEPKTYHIPYEPDRGVGPEILLERTKNDPEFVGVVIGDKEYDLVERDEE